MYGAPAAHRFVNKSVLPLYESCRDKLLPPSNEGPKFANDLERRQHKVFTDLQAPCKTRCMERQEACSILEHVETLEYAFKADRIQTEVALDRINHETSVQKQPELGLVFENGQVFAKAEVEEGRRRCLQSLVEAMGRTGQMLSLDQVNRICCCEDD